ncbi:MAG: CHAT domain-containing protein [Planctomycetota bacterium]
MVAVERFASLEAPEQVRVATTFAVLFSLTKDPVAPQTTVTSGPVDATGRLRMNLPAAPGRTAWDLDIVLSSPGCALASGSNLARISLPIDGDSTMARFDLVARPITQTTQATRLHATVWHAGAFLGRVSRDLTIAAAEAPRTEPASLPESPQTIPPPAPLRVALDLSIAPPDLTIYLRSDPSAPTRQEVTVVSRVFQTPTTGTWETGDTSKWLEERASELAATRAFRGRPAEIPDQKPQPAAARLVGLGRELYERCAPPQFQQVFWALAERLGSGFQSIAVYTDDPRVPWELMRPCTADGKTERGFLGTEFRLGRWHISPTTATRERPPQSFHFQQLAVVAPQYSGDRNLPGQRSELAALQQIAGYRAVAGSREALGDMLRTAATGILHYAGHGTMTVAANGTPTFAIQLEDGTLDLTTWRGLSPNRYEGNPLFFLNACEVGQAQRVARFVDGWAPLVLELGGVGCIGALCPVDDAGAAAFAVEFYRRVRTGLESGSASIGDALRAARRARLDAGDSSGLAYVYYGDPELKLLPRK